MPEFSEVSVQRLRVWSQEDQWVERRRAFQESVLDGVRKRIGNDLIQSQIEMVKDAMGIYERTLGMLQGTDGVDPPPAKSYEGLLGAFTRFISEMSEIRKDIIDVVVPPVIATGEEDKDEVPQIVPELSTSEARIAALAVVKARRGVDEDDEDE
jgi:hypothetical protein